MQHSKPWFAAKRYHYGSGLPIAWQGWLVLSGYLAVIAAASMVLSRPLAAATVVSSTVILMIVCAKRTAGGWRWRSGQD